MTDFPEKDREFEIDQGKTEEGSHFSSAQKKSNRTRLAWVALFSLFVIIASYYYTEPGRQQARVVARNRGCKNNLHYISMALHQYHDIYDSLPPAYLADENGKPMHSWRVLILPFLDEEKLYKKYRFDEPWDGPNNRKLHDKMPEVFRCPFDKNEHDERFTNYVAVLGEKTAWPFEKPVKFDEITDGLSNTIFVLEMKDSGIHWMEPRDLEFNKMSFKIDDDEKPSISNSHIWVDGSRVPFHVLMADGAYRLMPFDIPEKLLRAVLTINGGEKHHRFDR